MNSPAAQTMQAETPAPPALLDDAEGEGKASDSERLEQPSCNWTRSKPDQSVKIIQMFFGGRAGKLRRFSRAPSEALSSGEGPGEVGEDCLRGAAPSSAAARRFEQRKGVGVADRVSWGRLFFGYFILAKQKKVRPRVRRGTRRLRKAHLLPGSKDCPLIANQKGVFSVVTAVFRR